MYLFELKTITGKVVVGKHPQTGEEITTPLLMGMEDVPEGKIRDEDFHYRGYLMDLLQRAPVADNGMDIPQMRKQWKLLERLKKAKNGDTVQFEDPEWATVKELWEKSRWNLAMETLMQLDSDIIECKQQDAGIKPKGEDPPKPTE